MSENPLLTIPIAQIARADFSLDPAQADKVAQIVGERAGMRVESAPDLLARINAKYGIGGPIIDNGSPLILATEGTEKANFVADGIVGMARRKLHYNVWYSGYMGHGYHGGRYEQFGSPLPRVESISNIMREMTTAGISVPRVYSTLEGKTVYSLILPHSGKGWCARVTDHIEGASPLQRPTVEDIQRMAEIFARIHQVEITEKIVFGRDSWAKDSLVREYNKVEEQLITEAPEIAQEVLPYVEGMKNLDTSDLPKCLIHGDPQPSHALKTRYGDKIWIIDWECANEGYRVFDVSTLLAISCTDIESAENTLERYRLALESYEAINPLTASEREMLPFLIGATHAVFLLRSWTTKVEEWIEFSSKALGISTNIGKAVLFDRL